MKRITLPMLNEITWEISGSYFLPVKYDHRFKNKLGKFKTNSIINVGPAIYLKPNEPSGDMIVTLLHEIAHTKDGGGPDTEGWCDQWAADRFWPIFFKYCRPATGEKFSVYGTKYITK